MAPPYSYEQLDGVRTLSRIDPVDLSVDLENYVPVSLVRNGVLYIILYSMLATLLFVLLCAVLLKNGLSPQKRKLPIVWVLGFSMFGALLGSTLNMVYWAYRLFGESSPANLFRLWVASMTMLYLVPLITHVAIQMRIMSFYPPTLARRSKRIAISFLPTAFKIVRLLITILIVVFMSRNYKNGGERGALAAVETDRADTALFSLQLADTLYSSCILLWKFHHLGRRSEELMSKRSLSFWSWTQQVLYGIAFGYVVPTLFSLALLLCKIFLTDINKFGLILVSNVYVQSFGAVIACLSSSHRWREDRFTSSLVPGNSVIHGATFDDAETRDRSRASHIDKRFAISESYNSVGLASQASAAHTSAEQGNGRVFQAAAANSACDTGTESRLPSSEDAFTAGTSLGSDLPSHHEKSNNNPLSAAMQEPFQHSRTEGVSLGGSPALSRKLSLESHAAARRHDALGQSEDRRSSDATLFPPFSAGETNQSGESSPFGLKHLGKLLPDGSGSAPNSRASSRPGTGRRLGSSHSVLLASKLEEEDEKSGDSDTT